MKNKVKEFTPQTRLMDLVETKFHGELKTMIEELKKRQFIEIKDSEEWWRVKKLHFKHPSSMTNYEPIAEFIMQVTRNGNNGLKCSQRTFFRYITSTDHSNLNANWYSAKSLIYSIIRYNNTIKNGIF